MKQSSDDLSPLIMKRVPDILMLALPDGLSDRFSDDPYSLQLFSGLKGLWSDSVSFVAQTDPLKSETTE